MGFQHYNIYNPKTTPIVFFIFRHPPMFGRGWHPKKFFCLPKANPPGLSLWSGSPGRTFIKLVPPAPNAPFNRNAPPLLPSLMRSPRVESQTFYRNKHLGEVRGVRVSGVGPKASEGC